MRKLLPIILLLVGTGGGVGAGLAMKPAPSEDATEASTDGADAPGDDAHGKPDAPQKADHADGHGGHGDEDGAHTYVKLGNQFVVPVVTRTEVEALVVMSLSIELAGGNSDLVYSREPKLRDEFLQVLFDHANMGGFKGEFTNARTLDVLRGALLEVAQRVIGPSVKSVLITDLARQDT